MAAARRDIALAHLLDTALIKEAQARLDSTAYRGWYEAHISKYMGKGPVRLALIYVQDIPVGADGLEVGPRAAVKKVVLGDELVREDDPDGPGVGIALGVHE